MTGTSGSPPAPPPLPPQPKSSHQQPAPRPSTYLASLEAAGDDFFSTAVDIQWEDKPYRPIFYFFYGTLTKPNILKQVLGLKDEPKLRPAKVFGYALSSWGQYPALIDGSSGTEVAGYAYQVQSVDHEYKLAYYETNAYKLRICKIHFSDDEEPGLATGNTFIYAGDAEALRAGRFDRILWEMQMGMRLPEAWKTPSTGFMGLLEDGNMPSNTDARHAAPLTFNMTASPLRDVVSPKEIPDGMIKPDSVQTSQDRGDKSPGMTFVE